MLVICKHSDEDCVSQFPNCPHRVEHDDEVYADETGFSCGSHCAAKPSQVITCTPVESAEETEPDH